MHSLTFLSINFQFNLGIPLLLVTVLLVLVPTLLGVRQHRSEETQQIEKRPMSLGIRLWRFLGFLLDIYCAYIFWTSLEMNSFSSVTTFNGVYVLLTRVGGKPVIVKQLTSLEFYQHMNYAVRAFSALSLGISDVCIAYLNDRKDAWSKA
jgi:hypothetical protein